MMHMLRRIFAVLLVLAALLSCAFADDSVENRVRMSLSCPPLVRSAWTKLPLLL